MTWLTGYRRPTGKLAVTGDLLKPGYVMRDGNRQACKFDPACRASCLQAMFFNPVLL